MKTCLLSMLGCALPAAILLAQSTDQNFKHSIVPKLAVTNAGALTTGDPEKSSETITYYNGLGYPVQEVQRGVTPTRQDLVSFHVYNGYGIETKQFLPFRNATNTGGYEPGPQLKQSSFYNTTTGVEHSTHPYAQTVTDMSPLNRPVEQGFPGAAQQPGSSHTVRTNMRTNDANDQVIVFGFDYAGNLPELNKNVNLSMSTPVLRNAFQIPVAGVTYPSNGVYSSSPYAPNAPLWDTKSFGFNYPSSGAHSNKVQLSFGPGNYVLAFYARAIGSGSANIYINNNSTTIVPALSPKPSTGWMEYQVNISGTGSFSITIGIAGSSQVMLIDDIRLYNLNNIAYTPEYYPANTLVVTDRFDENNNKISEFKDKDGNLILSRNFLSSGVVTETYSVYNDHGLLAAVIPPKGVNPLATNNYSLTTPVNIMEKYGYTYGYDERKRIVVKKLPDAQVSYIVYDLYDRVVLIQDNNMRAKSTWLFTKYDRIGRVAYTGLFNSSSTRALLQQQVNGHSVLYEERSSSFASAYTSNAFPTEMTDTLSIFYYDDYDINDDGTNEWTDVSNTSRFGTIPYSKRTYGLPTATKHRVKDADGNISWTTSIYWYDKNQRPVFTMEYFPVTGYNAVYTLYNFNGQATLTKTFHTDNTVVVPKEVLRRYEYNHAGRLKNTWIKPPAMPEMLLAKCAYNDIGQLVVKDVHAFSPNHPSLQTINYKYHIRGWLRSINDMNLGKEDLFAMEFQYDNPFTHTNVGGIVNNTPLYNGNISSYQWTSQRDNATRGYVFGYDKLNRITDARYFGVMPARGSTPAVSENDRYNANNIVYDANGNILSMNHYGLTAPVTPAAPTPVYGQIDKFTYSYDGNRLLSVADNATYPTTQFNDLTDKNKTGNDFSYDANGNITKDLDKEITSITYDLLNMPARIVWANGERAEFTYDAGGRKWETKYFNAANVLIHDYKYRGAFNYYNNRLDAIAHEEGRLSADRAAPLTISPPPNNKYFYHYDYKDHQGNVRMTYTPDLDPNGNWKCTYEDPDVQTYPYKPDTARPDKPVFQNWTQPVRTAEQARESIYSGKVTDANGTYLTFDVQLGDTIEAEVYSKSSASDNLGQQPPANSWLYLFGINPGTITYDDEGTAHYSGPQLSVSLLNLINSLLNINTTAESQRAGAMIVRALDSAGNYIDGQMINAYYSSTWAKSSSQYLVTNPAVKQIQIQLTAKTGNTVYYDDFWVMRKRMLAKIVQENHYYPYGLNIKGLEYIAPPFENTYNLYNGKEMVLKNQLEWNDYGARYYDPQIGRWHVVDPMAEKAQGWTPYRYCFDNPVNLIDPDGMWEGDGDPLDDMRIRGNQASNLQGYVRNNGTRVHQGFDLAATPGTPVLAVKNAIVHNIISTTGGDYGMQIILRITNESGEITYAQYSHLSAINVRVNQEVNEGDIIGLSGQTGNAAGQPVSEAHLHFEYRSIANGVLGLTGRLDPNEVLDTKFYSQNLQANQTNTGVIKEVVDGTRIAMNLDGSIVVLNPKIQFEEIKPIIPLQ
jgi:RHS repeat-associated protein